MARPLWLVKLIKKNFKNRFMLASLTQKIPIYRKFIDWLMFENDLFFYLPKDHIVIKQSLQQPENLAVPSEIIRHFIAKSRYIWIMNTCICRESTPCEDYPIDIGCIFMGEAVLKIDSRLGKLVSKEEAYFHLERAREAGLVHSIGRNKLDTVWLGATPGDKLLTVCHCCPCCCLYRVLPDLDRSISSKITRLPGIKISVDPQLCIGCGKCSKSCLAQSIVIKDKKAQINELCVGCGRCIDVCPQKAIQLKIEDDYFIAESIRRISEKVDII